MKDILKSLSDLRTRIDEIDKEIINLLSERAKTAREIAEKKKEGNSVLYCPEREQEVYLKIKKLNKGILDNESLNNIFKEIMSAALKLEGSLKIAYLGPAGTFTHHAAIKKFGNSLELVPIDDVEEIFSAVESKKVQYGILPIENSIEGIVNSTLDSFIDYDLQIYAEINLLIRQNLISYAKELSEIETIFTHKQAYGQCRKWISKNLPSVKFIETTSTSKAVEFITKNKNSKEAAISSLTAAKIFNVPVLRENIEDNKKNLTRFVIIGNQAALPSGNDRTSIMFTLPHEAGSLYRALEPIFSAGINLTCIESRPMNKELWNYIFYLDMIGHTEDKKIKDALDKIKKVSTSFKILGSYPIDVT
ncbi:MAG: prephenate dehydratase [Spirochaetia bacterium]|nr:prephenate dehydratase [Spirochaetia bacterium]